MKAEAYPLRTIFGRDVRYVVPLYQRPYVWRRDTHWEPLFLDVLGVVQQWHARTPEERSDVSPHFLGAVVLDQKRTPVGAIEERHIIDGQQRLTTLQLMLAAAAEAASRAGFDRQSRVLQKLVTNDSDIAAGSDGVLKLRPTNVDRFTYDIVMGQPQSQDDRDDAQLGFSLVQEAHAYFASSISSWLADDDAMESSTPEERVDALVETLRSFIHIVVIDLEPRDNAQVIFETLNARGTPLLAVDLVKNLIFMRALDSDEDVGYLYRQYWRGFERWYWREEIVQGRLKRPRAELFLMHWLTMKSVELVNFHHLYSKFRELTLELGANEIPDLLKEFARDAQHFESFDEREIGTPEHRFFDRVKAMDTSILFPIVLFLFKQKGGVLTTNERNLALSALESWLVRRMICGYTPKAYNRIVLEILRAVRADPGRAHETIVKYLQSSTAETNVWPTDEEVVVKVRGLPMYGRIPRPRIRMILTAIENEMRSEKSEEVLGDSASLTVEHVLPQAWEMYWPNGESELDAQERERLLHSLGNLTLVTKKLNPAMSNGPWDEKRVALNSHSVLLLNRQLVSKETWNHEAIEARTEELAMLLTSIWPGPDADWSVPARDDQLKVLDPPVADSSLPQPEALIARFARGETQTMMEELLGEMSLWDDTHIRVGKAPKDESRKIYFSRRGTGWAAFCYIHPKTAELRLRLDPDEFSIMKYARVLDKGDYRISLSIRSSNVYREALNLAREAYAQSSARLDEE